MQTQKTGLGFKGQNIFVGIDVHSKGNGNKQHCY